MYATLGVLLLVAIAFAVGWSIRSSRADMQRQHDQTRERARRYDEQHKR